MGTTVACGRCGASLLGSDGSCPGCGVGGGGAPTLELPVAPSGPQDPLEAQLVQATLGDYQILGRLGKGGMATVYLAHDLALDRKVALKVMSPDLQLDATMAERFKQEARTAAGLSHPHIIPIYAVRESGRLLYIAMKFVEGRSLHDILRESGPLPVSMVCGILAQVGNALAFAHRRGVVHRDVKPDNILIDADGQVVVTDFGIAKVATSHGLTLAGSTVGTPTYMSPEQCLGQETSSAADQYSLGIVAYELLTGRPPFVAESVVTVIWSHYHERPAPLIDGRADCPASLAAAVMRMLAKSPADRWPGIEDAMAAAGAVPLPSDAPALARLAALARSRSARDAPALRRAPTPASPIPLTQPRPTVAVATLAVSPMSCGLAAGETVQLTATVWDAQGHTVPGVAPQWTSGDPAVATVSPSGLVVGHSAGQAVIEATVAGSGAIAFATVFVVWRGARDSGGSAAPAAPVAALHFPLTAGTLTVGESYPLEVEATSADGAPVSGAKIHWESSDPAVAPVSEEGVVAALSAGATKITAAAGAGRATFSLTVTRVGVARFEIECEAHSLGVGDDLRLGASARDRFGDRLRGRMVCWESDDPAVATVTSLGTVLAVAPGRVEIRATCAGEVARLALEVTPAVVAGLRISAPRSTLAPGHIMRLEVVATNPRGRALAGLPSVWASSDPSVAAVSPEGIVTALRIGTARIAVTVSGKRVTVPITVLR